MDIKNHKKIQNRLGLDPQILNQLDLLKHKPTFSKKTVENLVLMQFVEDDNLNNAVSNMISANLFYALEKGRKLNFRKK